MKNAISNRGFDFIMHPTHATEPKETRLVSVSAIGDYDDAFDRCGTSFLWFGDRHHLNREEVAELRDALTRWLEKGTLFDGRKVEEDHREKE